MTPSHSARQLYGFPPALMEQVDELFPGNAGACGLCGDTILGGRHRVIDGITERLVVGEVDTGDDYDISARDLWIVVAASYEHDKALKKQRRAERKEALPNAARPSHSGGDSGG